MVSYLTAHICLLTTVSGWTSGLGNFCWLTVSLGDFITLLCYFTLKHSNCLICQMGMRSNTYTWCPLTRPQMKAAVKPCAVLLWPLLLFWWLLLSSMITWCSTNLYVVFLAVVCTYDNLRDPGGCRCPLVRPPLPDGFPRPLFKCGDRDGNAEGSRGRLLLFKTSSALPKCSSQRVSSTSQ